MQGRRSTEFAYNLRSSSNHSAMSLPGGGSSSIQRPMDIDLNVLDEARHDTANPIRNDHFAPARESTRHKRKNHPSSSSTSSDASTGANISEAPNSRNEDFVRNTRARSNYYVIDLEEETNDESESDEPIVDSNPNQIASELVPSVDNSVSSQVEEDNEGNQERVEREMLTLDEDRDADSDNGSNGSDVDYSGLLRALVAVRERRDGRGRVLTEIRNVLDILRNSDNAGNDDISFVHRVMSMARNNLFDRHREMRLDVDNMSYEELLALEERMGDVNTGLSEEKIKTCLKQRVFIPSGSSDAFEPCCICQEEYVKGAEMGQLGCGHEFHLDCIKQWLSHKNSCPICKSSAMDTDKF